MTEANMRKSKMRKIKDIKPGSRLYVSSSFYIDHGEDDVQGGSATVEKVIYKPLPLNPINEYFVMFKGLAGLYNLAILLEKQEDLRRQYKGKKAHKDPDYV